jgi:predicted  nucleic acid-binding Zn-ribbon protein
MTDELTNRLLELREQLDHLADGVGELMGRTRAVEQAVAALTSRMANVENRLDRIEQRLGAGAR